MKLYAAAFLLLSTVPGGAESVKSASQMAQGVSLFLMAGTTCTKFFPVNTVLAYAIVQKNKSDGEKYFGKDYFSRAVRGENDKLVNLMTSVSEEVWCNEIRGMLRQQGNSDLFP